MLRKIIDTLRAYSQFRRTYEELSRLSDRDLADLGICRCDIARVAMDGAYS